MAPAAPIADGPLAGVISNRDYSRLLSLKPASVVRMREANGRGWKTVFETQAGVVHFMYQLRDEDDWQLPVEVVEVLAEGLVLP